MVRKFLMSTPNAQVSSLLKTFGYEETDGSVTPDFMVFTGGADVTPSLYFKEEDLRTYTDKRRDYTDYCTLIAGRLQRVPMLGICRGMQFLHVAGGGTLTQHISGHAGTSHKLLMPDGTPIYGWDKLYVNSTHHQCVPIEETNSYDEVYVSHDGVTEAIVSKEKNFVGVQFHPEYPTASEESVEFFEKATSVLNSSTFSRVWSRSG